MKRFVLIALAALFAFIAAPAAHAVSLTCTSGTATLAGPDDIGGYNVYLISWTAGTTGAASGCVRCTAGLAWSGVVERVTTQPGSVAPSGSYVITFSDPRGSDPFFGIFTSVARSASATQDIVFMGPANVFNTTTLLQTVNTNVSFRPWQMVSSGVETFVITGAGAGGKGYIRIFVRK